ncbi:TetR/AcrR family transcriptional regulator [Streptomyces sp. NPDC006879]|uniref:TetR/AcrR family transcriptional regulator n=1 Tax=Streptomyces sp. NPDC006879 TaxID=3364767 RepID=UPI00369BC130
MTDEEAKGRLLDAAETLFYAHGVQAVGMDRIRTASGVPLKRLYRLFPAKEALVAAYLERRDQSWMRALHSATAAPPEPRERVLAVFDWLEEWFGEPGFRGCAFLNAHGELGDAPRAILAPVHRHKAELRSHLVSLAEDAGADSEFGEELLLLVEGATATAALTPGTEPARRARRIAEALLPSTRP